MGIDECYLLGNVVKTHGLKGEVVFFLDVDDPTEYKKMESVFVRLNGKLVPFFILSMRLNGSRATMQLEDVQDLEQAQELVGQEIYLPLSRLPELEDGGYYYHDLVGFDLLDRDRHLGKVKQIYQLPTHHLLGVDHKGQEILIPTQDEIIKNVDLENQVIHAELPEGLLDIYLEQKP